MKQITNMARNEKLKKTEKRNELLKRMLVKKGVTALADSIGGEKVLGELGDIDDLLDIPDIVDVEESD